MTSPTKPLGEGANENGINNSAVTPTEALRTPGPVACLLEDRRMAVPGCASGGRSADHGLPRRQMLSRHRHHRLHGYRPGKPSSRPTVSDINAKVTWCDSFEWCISSGDARATSLCRKCSTRQPSAVSAGREDPARGAGRDQDLCSHPERATHELRRSLLEEGGPWCLLKSCLLHHM